MDVTHHQHPLWSLLRFLILAVCLTVFAWLNAHTFDKTEIWMIVQTLVAMGGYDGLTKLLKRGTHD